MSGNLLSKNHPFRASVTHGNVEIVSSTPMPSASAPITEDNNKPSSKFNLSPKSKIICYLTLGIIIAFGWMQIYDSLYPPKDTALAKNDKHAKAGKQITYEEVGDFEWGYNERMSEDFSMQAEKPGWFKQTFCKGVKRSLFCR